MIRNDGVTWSRELLEWVAFFQNSVEGGGGIEFIISEMDEWENPRWNKANIYQQCARMSQIKH